MGTELFDIILFSLLGAFIAFRLYAVLSRRTGLDRAVTIGLDWTRALALALLLGLFVFAVFVAMWDYATPTMVIGFVAGCILVPLGLLLMAYWSVWPSRSKPPAEPK